MSEDYRGRLLRILTRPGDCFEILYFIGIIIIVAFSVVGIQIQIDAISLILPLVYNMLFTQLYLVVAIANASLRTDILARKKSNSLERSISRIHNHIIGIGIGLIVFSLFFLYLPIVVLKISNSSSQSDMFWTTGSLVQFVINFIYRSITIDLWNGISLGITAWFHVPRVWKIYSRDWSKENEKSKNEMENMIAQPDALFGSVLLTIFLPIVLIWYVADSFLLNNKKSVFEKTGMIIIVCVTGLLFVVNQNVIETFKVNYYWWTSSLMIIAISLTSIKYIISANKENGGR